jgi:hypothetical protein
MPVINDLALMKFSSTFYTVPRQEHVSFCSGFTFSAGTHPGTLDSYKWHEHFIDLVLDFQLGSISRTAGCRPVLLA